MIKTFFVVLLSFYVIKVQAQMESLRKSIMEIINSKQADVGVAVLGMDGKDSININGARHYPMQSVFKFHIALAMLHEVDKGKFSLDSKIHIDKKDLLPEAWSPLQKEYPDGDVDLPLIQIIHYTVSLSDNSGCDILLKLLGGPTAVESYIHSLGVNDVSILITEEENHKEWDAQFKNWTTPLAAAELLKRFYNNNILSRTSYEFLWQAMVDSPTGKKRIKGELPAGTVVAHKTGTSGISEEGIIAAVNDIGIVTLPNGQHYAISVFITNTKENDEVNDKIIADISKVVWDYFISKEK